MNNRPQEVISDDTSRLQGLDGLNFESIISAGDKTTLNFPNEYDTSSSQKKYISVECINGKVLVYINPVLWTRPDNIIPLRQTEADKLDQICPVAIDFVRGYLQRHLGAAFIEDYVQSLKVTKIECNLTLACVGGAKPSDVISLFEHVFDETVMHRKFMQGFTKINTSVYCKKSKNYKLKIYDKTEEGRSKGIHAIGDDMLRIEMIFYNRSLDRIFGKDGKTIRNVLQTKTVGLVAEEYKRVFGDLLQDNVKPYLGYCVQQLSEHISSSSAGRQVSDAISRCRYDIPDFEIIRRALKHNERSRALLSYYKKQELFPTGVLDTIKNFRLST